MFDFLGSNPGETISICGMVVGMCMFASAMYIEARKLNQPRRLVYVKRLQIEDKRKSHGR